MALTTDSRNFVDCEDIYLQAYTSFLPLLFHRSYNMVVMGPRGPSLQVDLRKVQRPLFTGHHGGLQFKLRGASETLEMAVNPKNVFVSFQLASNKAD